MQVVFMRLSHTIFQQGLSMEEFLQNTIPKAGMADTYCLFYRTETNSKILPEFWQVIVDLGVLLTSAVSHL